MLSEYVDNLNAMGFKTGKILSVWSNGVAVTRYMGQDKREGINKISKRSKEKGYKKYVAILVEVDE